MTRAVGPTRSLIVALLGFFIITLDALVVSVALPEIRETLGGGIAELQWVVDGYTLPFAALLLLAGTLSDRLGARWTFGAGVVTFTISSVVCAFAPSMGHFLAARAFQGIGAALMTPASLALIGEAYKESTAKARAIGLWAIGGAVASASGPLIGGALTMISWRLIFLINLPVGLVTLWLLYQVPTSRRHATPFDWSGQAAALVALTALTFGLIEAGQAGIGSPLVLVPLVIASIAGILFFALEARVDHPIVPLGMFRSRAVATTVAIGFTFMVGFYGMVFLVSLFLQEQRGMTPLETGLAFLPVTGFSIVMPMIAARLGEYFGPWFPITLGQLAMAVGLFGLSVFADTASVPVLIGWMILVGLGGGTAMPSATSLLLNSVPESRSGTASGVLNTSRQVGGALAIAAFGALLSSAGFNKGIKISFAIAALLLIATMLLSLRLRSSQA